MKKDFESFYDECLQDEELYVEWEVAKKEKNIKLIISLIIIIIIDVCIWKLLKDYKYMIKILCSMAFFVPIDSIIYELINKPNKGKYNKLYKKNIMNKLINKFFDNVSYKPNKSMPESIYKFARDGHLLFIDFLYDKYYSEDYIECTIGGKNFIRMAEFKTIKYEKRVNCIINGLFVVIKLNKSIKGKLEIRPDSETKKKYKIKLDSQEFEEYFNVYTDENILATRILTHDIMKFLIKCRKRIGKKFAIAIIDNEMYIRVFAEEMFEPSINNKNFIDKIRLKREYDIIEFIYELSKKMVELINEMEI